MAATIPTTEPDFIYSGDTLTFTKELSDYSPADGWALSYLLKSDDANGTPFVILATTSGVGFLVSYDTTALPAATYRWQARVTDGSSTFTVGEGKLQVAASLAKPGDTRTQARRILDAIESVIEGRASSSVLKSTVEGTTLERIPPADLLKLRDRYAVIVANEDARRTGKPSRQNIYVQFTNP